MTDTALQLVGAVLLVVANGFFVAAEFALVAADRTRIDAMAASGNRRARVVAKSLSTLGFELSGAQLGITVTSLMLGVVAEPAVGELLRPALERIPGLDGGADAVSVVLALVLATMFQMIFGELVPKNVAIARPIGVALVIAPLHRLYTRAAFPLIRFLDAAAIRAVRVVGVEPREELGMVRTLEELELLIASSGEAGLLEPASQQLLQRTIRFGDKTAADALVPRTSLSSLAADATVDDLVRLARETGYSRFPVFAGDLDHIVGVVHVRQALPVPAESRAEVTVATLATETLVVPESRLLDDLLVEMRAGGTQMTVVIDEYGGTAGVITIEDLLEEIVGEIRDEFDRNVTERLTVLWRPGTFLLDGGLHRDEVTEIAGLVLPDGPFETLAGHLLVRFDRIPGLGDTVTDEAGWTYEVVEMDRLRISRVRASAPPMPDDEAGQP
ncbi:MAG TPA: hemolysin family protein [Acidimicrobiales bacterium]